MVADLPATADAVGAIVALSLAVGEARRVRARDRRARLWFVVFLTSAAVLTIFAVQVMQAPRVAR